MYTTSYAIKESQSRIEKLKDINLGYNSFAKSSRRVSRLYYLQKIAEDPSKEEWKNLLKMCDEQAYSVKQLDAIGDYVNGILYPVMRPLVKAISAVVPYIVSMHFGKTVVASESLNLDRKYKIAKLYNNIDPITFLERELISIASNEGVFADTLEDLSAKLNKQADWKDLLSKGLSTVGKGTAKTVGGLLPYVGIITDFTITAKNFYEAWTNGKKIIYDLPLEKYGISYLEALIPTPGNTSKISDTLSKLVPENSSSISNLKDILDIAQTLKGYATDFVSTITNFLMVIIDALDFTGIGFIASFLLSIPLIGVEMVSDYIAESSYGAVINGIKKICADNIAGKVTITQSDMDFMKKMIGIDDSASEVPKAESKTI